MSPISPEGWLAARLGLNATLISGTLLQIVALLLLTVPVSGCAGSTARPGIRRFRSRRDESRFLLHGECRRAIGGNTIVGMDPHEPWPDRLPDRLKPDAGRHVVHLAAPALIRLKPNASRGVVHLATLT